MAEYQNIFTRVQVHGPADMGLPMGTGTWARQGTPSFNRWFGKIGDAYLAGDVKAKLRAAADAGKFALELVPSVCVDDVRVSSSGVRSGSRLRSGSGLPSCPSWFWRA